jgi:hypothetical protein
MLKAAMFVITAMSVEMREREYVYPKGKEKISLAGKETVCPRRNTNPD